MIQNSSHSTDDLEQALLENNHDISSTGETKTNLAISNNNENDNDIDYDDESRTCFEISTGEKTCCGVLLRLVALTPLPLFVLFLAFTATATSSTGDIIHILIDVCAVAVLYLSRFFSYVNNEQTPRPYCNNAFEIFEIIVVSGCSGTAYYLVGHTNYVFLSIHTVVPCGPIAFTLAMTIPMNLLVKQVKLAQKEAITGYFAKFSSKFVIALFVTIVIIFYTTIIQTVGTKHKQMSPCLNYTTAIDLILYQAVPSDVYVICCLVWVWIFFDAMFVGRGMIRQNQNGSMDGKTLALFGKLHMIVLMLILAMLAFLACFCTADLILSGNFLTSPPPISLPIHPLTVDEYLPSFCNGSCRDAFMGMFTWAICVPLIAIIIYEVCPYKPSCDNCRCRCVKDTGHDLLEMGAQTAEDLLDSNQKAFLMAHLRSMDTTSNGDKFLGTTELISGALENLTEGLQSFLRVSDLNMTKIRQNPEQAIIDEVNALGNVEVIELLKYIREEPISHKKYPNGIRDQGRQPGTCLQDFMMHENVSKGSLKRCHVIALRLYTTAAYKFINNPLRNLERKNANRQHPLAACVIYIEEGIKKLRNVISKKHSANKAAGKDQGTTVLWRGLKSVHANKAFIMKGGAELAPMSTTSDFKVAVQYGTCAEGSLLLKIVVESALNHGADLQWLSAFPGEAEVLYPPLTYLESQNRRKEYKCEETGIVVTILELKPRMSASA